MYSWLDLKGELRRVLWPGGEQVNLVTAHDKFFLDAIMDIQKFVECAQQDNTDIAPQCNTFYRCGLTVLDAPRGRIKKVSVIDKLNPSSLLEDPTMPDDWCSEIDYQQIDFCHVDHYFKRSQHARCCLPIGLFFGFPCHKAHYPVPTDAGVLPGLPVLPIGYHYPQTSTDRFFGRSHHGRWALDRGKIYIVPWIQSTESVVIKWDGIKRVWADGDPVDQDPDLSKAIMEYVRWQHCDKFDKDEAEAARAQVAYREALAVLIHECWEETHVRGCEGSLARMSTPTLVNLYYNDSPQTGHADCQDGTTGDSKTVTIPSGTVSSSLSIADANAKALTQAQSQAQAQLVCTPVATVYASSVDKSFTAVCTSDGLHAVDYTPITVIVLAGTPFPAATSQANADDLAQAQAQASAEAQLHCVYWNKSITVTLVCPNNAGLSATITIPAHTYSNSDQSMADQLATNDATNQANASLQAQGCGGGTVYWNTTQHGHWQGTSGGCTVFVDVTMPNNKLSSTLSQADANQKAINAALAFAQVNGARLLLAHQCGTYTVIWPNLPA